jgi:hypothetical protein
MAAGEEDGEPGEQDADDGAITRKTWITTWEISRNHFSSGSQRFSTFRASG